MAELETINRLLTSGVEEERLQGLRLLSGAGEQFPLEQVLKALGDESWRVRKEAVELLLGQPRAAEFADLVAGQLHSQDNAGLRNAAMEILIRLGRRSLPTLLRELGSEDHDVRKFVVDILGEIGDRSTIPTLIEAMGDPDENVRYAAAENLGKLRAAEAVAALLEAMESANLWYRFTILEALGQIGRGVDTARLLRFKGEPLLRKALFDCLGRVGGADAVPVLVEGLTDAMRNVREAAALALVALAGQYPDEVRSGLSAPANRSLSGAAVALLEGDDPRLREAAVKLLGWIGDAAQARRLLELFEDPRLGESAARALVDMGAQAVSTLVAEGRQSDPRTLAYLCHLCGEVGCAEGLELLLEGVSHSDPEVRTAAVQALGRLRRSEAIGPLAQALRDAQGDVRQGASLALDRLGQDFPEAVLDGLRPMLGAEDPDIRMHAVSVVGRLDLPEVERLLVMGMKDPSGAVRRAAVRSLDGHPGGGQLQVLMFALTDEEAEVRAEAAAVLGRCGGEEALEPLALAVRDEDIWVRSAAVRSLGQVGGGEAVALLEQATSDPVGLVVIGALETLAELAPDRAAAALQKGLRHEDAEVVKAALQLLARSGSFGWLAESRSRLLAHSHPEVRLAVLELLGGAEDPASRADLEARLQVEEDDLVRLQIQDCLARLGAGRG